MQQRLEVNLCTEDSLVADQQQCSFTNSLRGFNADPVKILGDPHQQ